MSRTEILISGFGGQGVVRIGQTIGLAAVLSDLHTTMLVSHGTETRGGYVRTQVVISDSNIDSPVVEKPSFFCAMSKAAYERFYKMVDKTGIILYDPAYVKTDDSIEARQIAVPVRDLASEKLGNELFANMIMYGYIISHLKGKIGKEQAIEALKQRIPRMIDENIEAFKLGFEL
jgi:2-oxoglutarate ferredoxin oxidoreductase subunit gamma